MSQDLFCAFLMLVNKLDEVLKSQQKSLIKSRMMKKKRLGEVFKKWNLLIQSTGQDRQQSIIFFFLQSIISLNIETNWSSRSNLIKKGSSTKVLYNKETGFIRYIFM